MKLILHHLAHDVHAQRWSLLFLFVILVLSLGLDWLEAQPSYQLAAAAEFVGSTTVLCLSATIVWAALLARLIQSEPVIGETSYWLTRPVPRRVYIPSKLLFVALFLVAPWMVELPLDMLRFGVEPQRVAEFLRIGAIAECYLVLVLLWMASFTRTLTGFWALLLATLLGGVMLLSAGAYVTVVLGANPLLTTTRWGLFVVILAAGLLVSLALQHTRRKSRDGFRLGVTACFIALLAGFLFPFRLPEAFTRQFIWGNFISPSKFVPISFADDWRQHFIWAHNPSTDEWIARAAFAPVDKNLSGIPVVENAQVFFKPGNSAQVKLSNGVSTANVPESQFDFAQAIAADLPGYQLENMPGQTGPFLLSLFTFNRATDRDLLGQTGELQVSLYGSMRTLVREAVIPLNGPGLACPPGQIIHAARLPRIPAPFFMADTDDKPVLAVWTLSYRNEDHFRPAKHYYLLVNPSARTAKLVPGNESYGLVEGMSAFSSKDSRHVYIPLRGDEALGQMVLYIYELKLGDTFDTKLTDPNFTMSPK